MLILPAEFEFSTQIDISYHHAKPFGYLLFVAVERFAKSMYSSAYPQTESAMS